MNKVKDQMAKKKKKKPKTRKATPSLRGEKLNGMVATHYVNVLLSMYRGIRKMQRCGTYETIQHSP